MTAPVGIGVIGYGRAAQLHLPVLQRTAGARLVALAGPNLDKVARVAARFKIPHCYHQASELIEDPRVDAVVICTPPTTHADLGLEVLRTNKHLLVEKPLAVSADESKRLLAASRGVDVISRVGFHLRSHALIRTARRWLDEGRLGELELLRTVFTSGIRWNRKLPTWRADREQGGGVLIESAVHHFDLWRLLGGEVAELQVLQRSDQIDDASAVVSGRLAGGALASTHLCQGTADALEIELFGSKGRLRIHGYRLDGLRFEPSGLKGFAKLWPQARLLSGRAVRSVRGLPRGHYAKAYQEQWKSFVRSIQTGTLEGPSFEDGHAATQIVTAAVQSAKSGTSTRL